MKQLDFSKETSISPTAISKKRPTPPSLDQELSMPHLQKDKYKLEMVQRRLARFVTNRYRNRSSVTDMLEQLKWTPLEYRRKNACLSMLYKIRNQEVHVAASLKLLPPDTSSRNMGTNSFQIPQCNTTTRKG